MAFTSQSLVHHQLPPPQATDFLLSPTNEITGMHTCHLVYHVQLLNDTIRFFDLQLDCRKHANNLCANVKVLVIEVY